MAAAGAGSSLARTITDDPGPVAVTRRGPLAALRVARASVVDPRSTSGHRTVGPGKRLLDVGLGVADQQTEDRESACGDLGVPSGRAIDERDRGDRRADEPALPARWRVHELLELRPAVWLGQDALADGVGERVDRDPVPGLASGAPDQLPGALRLARQGDLEDVRRRTSAPRVRLPQEVVRREQERRRANQPRVADLKSATDAPGGADCGHRALPRCPVRRAAARCDSRDRRAPPGRRRRAVARSVGSPTCSASRRPSVVACVRWSATNSRAWPVVEGSGRVGANAARGRAVLGVAGVPSVAATITNDRPAQIDRRPAEADSGP